MAHWLKPGPCRCDWCMAYRIEHGLPEPEPPAPAREPDAATLRAVLDAGERLVTLIEARLEPAGDPPPSRDTIARAIDAYRNLAARAASTETETR